MTTLRDRPEHGPGGEDQPLGYQGAHCPHCGSLMEPGVDYHSKPHPPGTEELVVCLSGSLEVGPEGHEVELGEGDAARFQADRPHSYHSAGGCVALCLMSHPPAG